MHACMQAGGNEEYDGGLWTKEGGNGNKTKQADFGLHSCIVQYSRIVESKNMIADTMCSGYSECSSKYVKVFLFFYDKINK